MKASARLGAVRAVLQRSLPSLLGPERLGDLSNDPEAASEYRSWLPLSNAGLAWEVLDADGGSCKRTATM